MDKDSTAADRRVSVGLSFCVGGVLGALAMLLWVTNPSQDISPLASLQEDSMTHGFDVHIVFFAYLPANVHWQQFLTMYLTSLRKTGLTRVAASTHICLSAENALMFEQGLVVVTQTLPQAVVHRPARWGNLNEYPGIQKVWQLANEHPGRKSIIVYFHGKGLTHGPKPFWMGFDAVIRPWYHILDLLKRKESINKVGWASSRFGWVWWNYWYVRASYARRCVEPTESPRRYYYEEWLGRANNSEHCQVDKPIEGFCYSSAEDVYNLLDGRTNSSYAPGQYIDLVAQLRVAHRYTALDIVGSARKNFIGAIQQRNTTIEELDALSDSLLLDEAEVHS